MEIKDLVSQNEYLIEKFNIKAYLAKKNYAIVGALTALEVTNEVQKHFFDSMDKEKTLAEKLMDLYGLLQSLFVSIDGLYELAYLVSGSRKFININKNDDLRKLKHIRNDVVGHPANRNTRDMEACYCILDKSSLTNDSFRYLMCKESKILEKEVALIPLIEAYYIESNKLLNNLLNISNHSIGNEHIIVLIDNLIKKYPYNTYLDDLDNIYKDYMDKYKTKDLNNRFVWRYELIKEIEEFKTININDNLKSDVIYLQLAKIYHIITAKNLNKTSYGDTIKYTYRFLRKNLDLYNDRIYLCDLSHPYFAETLNKFIKRAKNNKNVLYYFKLIEELANLNLPHLVYAYALPIKNFKKS